MSRCRGGGRGGCIGGGKALTIHPLRWPLAFPFGAGAPGQSATCSVGAGGGSCGLVL